MCERTLMQITNALFAGSRRMKELSEPPTERDQVCPQLNLLRERSMAADRFANRCHFFQPGRIPCLEVSSSGFFRRFLRIPGTSGPAWLDANILRIVHRTDARSSRSLGTLNRPRPGMKVEHQSPVWPLCKRRLLRRTH